MPMLLLASGILGVTIFPRATEPRSASPILPPYPLILDVCATLTQLKRPNRPLPSFFFPLPGAGLPASVSVQPERLRMKSDPEESDIGSPVLIVFMTSTYWFGTLQ